MQLPEPEADELGQPVWNVTSAEVSRAYRKMSVLVHPDKNSGADAQQAFEALNQAHRKLRDRGELVRSRLVFAYMRQAYAISTLTCPLFCVCVHVTSAQQPATCCRPLSSLC